MYHLLQLLNYCLLRRIESEQWETVEGNDFFQLSLQPAYQTYTDWMDQKHSPRHSSENAIHPWLQRGRIVKTHFREEAEANSLTSNRSVTDF